LVKARIFSPADCVCLLKPRESPSFRTDNKRLAAASVVDISVSSWEDLITLTIVDLYETEKPAHLEASTFSKIEVPLMRQREF
jgi:hypothetical protein